MKSPAEFLGIATFPQLYVARLEFDNAQSVSFCPLVIKEYKGGNSRFTWNEVASDQVWVDCHFS